MRIRDLSVAFLVLAAPVLDAQTVKEEREAFLRANLDRFPLVVMAREEIPFAKTQVLEPAENPPEHNGKFFTGFRFTTPDWLDAPVIWMFTWPGPEEAIEGIEWYIVPEEPDDRTFRLSRSTNGGRRFPKFHERFPECSRFMFQHFPLESLQPSKNYIVWFSLPTAKLPELRFALTVGSHRGLFEFGMLPTGYPDMGPGQAFLKDPSLKPRTPKEIVAEAVAAYRKSGIEAGLAHLDRELAGYVDAAGKFRDFYVEVWREAQVGGGRTDRQWAASVNEWLQRRCLSYHAFLTAEETCANTASAMMSANRYASAKQALEPFIEGMERRLVALDPAEHPDEGPGLASLPEVRLRRYPPEANRPISMIGEDGWVRTTRAMAHAFGGTMLSLAELEFMGGHWKTALERKVAVADWAERTRGKTFEAEDRWYKSRRGIAGSLQSLDLLEAADAEYEAILAKGWPDIYQKRTLLESRHERIAIRIALGNADASMLAELDELHESLRKNPFVHSIAWEGVAITKARCLAALGRHDEADGILAGLPAENHLARAERIRLRLATERIDGLEQELIAVLTAYREWGRKIDEAGIYSLYADFLEAAGRHAEAIRMRRESIRLMRGFDLFSLLPPELARLSSLLGLAGDATGAKAAADEARALAARRERIPERIAGKVAGILSRTAAVTVAAGPLPSVDLQPSRAVVIPLAGRPLRGKLTLSNPSTRTIEGTLGFDGMPVEISADQESGDIHVSIGSDGGQDRVSGWRLDPGSYTLISLASPGDTPPQGELNVWWSSPGQEEKRSLWTFEAAEQGVSSAVIDAGEYQRNPFHGVPIHHHYQHGSADAAFASLRVTASVPARIECYSDDDQPVFIDANGNGSLADPGDELFSDEDRDGQADIRLHSGEGAIRLQVYPDEDIPKEGLILSLEALIDGQWTKVAEDRLLP